MIRTTIVLAVALATVAWALPAKPALAGQEMVDFINRQGKWKATLNPRFNDLSEVKKLLGARKRSENPNFKNIKIQPKSAKNADLPTTFDARDNWPACADVIGTIADQSSCGSCWAVSAASVMSDRVCIGTQGQTKTPISANDVISCCYECGFGCDGGWPDEAFEFWTDSGVVSGSGYTVDQGCLPYPFPECEHHNNKTKYQPCPSDLYDTPSCSQSCQSSYSLHKYKDDKFYGQNAVFYSEDVQATQQEIFTNGPVVFTFDVYADFLAYSSGVYQHLTGDYLGGHAVRAIGWGEENGTPYWLIANSWNEDWGDQGYFKIIRGQDDCGIEDEVSAAIANTNKLPK